MNSEMALKTVLVATSPIPQALVTLFILPQVSPPQGNLWGKTVTSASPQHIKKETLTVNIHLTQISSSVIWGHYRDLSSNVRIKPNKALKAFNTGSLVPDDDCC